MSLFTGLEKIVRTDEPLAPRTWLGIGGKADYFIEPEDLDQLVEMIRKGGSTR